MAPRREVADIPVAILCGGRGTRLQEHTHAIPKPLVEIGSMPILWHVVRIYAAQGFRRFLLLTGYLGDQVAEFAASAEWPEPVELEAIDTGLDTPTGGRLAAIGDRLRAEGGTFCATYADGVADIDLSALLGFHSRHGGDGSMTVVRPYSQFGITNVGEDGLVTSFEEKPRLDDWVNGGFFCFEPPFLDLLEADSVLERDPLRRLAARGELHAYRHTGFWDCMDTYKDAVVLGDLWRGGTAPWAVWERHAAAASSRSASA
ncbi:NTP transferase domain-containing protein [Thermoleophilia bacterium SCSIO 60948]|nr:NTP transferase domain-containing protein [Thermoleophilia bacterium SCSIO 60948]